MDSVQRCSYCGGAVDDVNAPDDDDDHGWELLSHQHIPGCEWVETRAHSRVPWEPGYKARYDERWRALVREGMPILEAVRVLRDRGWPTPRLR